MNKNTVILIIASIVILVGLMTYGSMQMKKNPTVYEPYATNTETPSQDVTTNNDKPVTPPSTQPEEVPPSSSMKGGVEVVACTMDAKQCPDGSYVGRTGPQCEFAPCPGN